MALRVWLPLNGNLDNQGLDGDITVTNNGATVNNSGKIGKTYIFNGLSNYINVNDSNLYNIFKGGSTPFSISLWVNHTADQRAILFGDYGLSGSISFNFELYANHTVRIYWAGNPDKTFSGSSVGLNTWTHICVTYDGTKMYCYKNGSLLSDIYSGTLPAKSKTSGTFNIGMDYRSATAFTGKMNDFRIYDHCLSPKEVKELSKGLVIHYKLDDIINKNLLTNTEKRININGVTASREYMQLCNPLNIYDTYGLVPYTISFDVKSAVAHSFSLYGTPGSNPKYTFTSKTINVTTEWQRIVYTFTPRIYSESGTWAAISIYGIYDSGAIPTVRNVKLELGSVETQMVNDDDLSIFNTIYDCSGYRNNGIINGSLLPSIDTLRYKYSTRFNGNDSCITIPYKQANPDGIFTVNLWFKKDGIGSKNYESLFGGPSGFEMDTRAGSSTTLSLYMASIRGGNVFSPFNLNQWYMVTMTRDGTNELYYINGELKKTIEAKSMPNGIYYIGAWSTIDKQNYYGNISDFRIYSTVLSPEDILELYNTSAIVDNQGDLMCFEAEEEDIDFSIFKTGEVKINEFIEVNDCIYLPAGTFIDTELYYNNGDKCRAETIIRYESGGSGRDLMGFSPSSSGYWGVKADGTWEVHGSFTYTDANITKKNTIIYQYTASTSVSGDHGNYKVGALGSSFSVRNKYIYRVRLYKNDVLERDLYPMKLGDKVGLYDALYDEYYLANNTNGTLNNDSTIEASIFKKKVEINQLLEI